MKQNELYHYNHNHDPRTGQFTSGSGARGYKRSIRRAESGRVKTAAKYMRAERFNNSKRATQLKSKMKSYEHQTLSLIKEAQAKGYTVTSKSKLRSGQRGVDTGMFIVGGVPLYAIYRVGEWAAYDDYFPVQYKGRTINQNPATIASYKYKVRK